MSNQLLVDTNQKANQVRELIKNNIKTSLENNAQIEHIDDISLELPIHAQRFHRNSRALSCKERCNNYKVVILILIILVLLILFIIYTLK